MKPTVHITANSLDWIQVKAGRKSFELRASDELVGTLEWVKPSGSLAIGRIGDKGWTCKRVGFFNPRVTVRLDGSETDIGAFKLNAMMGDGTFEFHNGSIFNWEPTEFWRTKWCFSRVAGHPLIIFETQPETLGDIFEVRAHVEVEPAALSEPEFPLLVILGWYLIILLQE